MTHANYIVVVNAKPARAVALLLGDDDSSHASTDPPGGFHCPSGPDRSISLVVGPDNVSTGRWVVDQGTGRRGSGGPCAPGHLDVVSQRDYMALYKSHIIIKCGQICRKVHAATNCSKLCE